MSYLSLIFILLGMSSVAVAQTKAVPGEYIVKLRKGVSAKQAFASPQIKSKYQKAKRIKGTNGRLIRIKMKKGVRANGVREFSSNPAFEYIEPNYIASLPKFKRNGGVKKTNVSQDKMFKKLWGLNSKLGFDIGALDSWKYTKGSKRVVVAVIDTGVDYSHPDLKSNIWVNRAELNGKPGVDDDNNGYIDDKAGYNMVSSSNNVMDVNGHGTHCAGTIGALHNTIGVAGVAAKVRLMPVKVLSDSGSGSYAGIAEGVIYAVDNGAHVLSLSLGGGSVSRAMNEAIKYAESKGVVLVFAAGNNGWNEASYPAVNESENIISVAAIEESGDRASFSNYDSSSVDVAAPGKDILSTTPGGEYRSFSGTSMATPHVSGVIALMLSMNSSKWLNKKGSAKNLNIPAKKIREMLVRTSVPHGPLSGVSVSNGYVKASALLKKVNGLIRK